VVPVTKDLMNSLAAGYSTARKEHPVVIPPSEAAGR
jgi:hypothetical protein